MLRPPRPPSSPHHHQRYILALRIKELTDVLDRLGMRRTGRKAELQARVMSIFGEGAAK